MHVEEKGERINVKRNMAKGNAEIIIKNAPCAAKLETKSSLIFLINANTNSINK